uniref:Flavin-containing monooxygenase n=1 Tax=Steinernema glaseri TaxID=37863 RepID=A0A1I8ADU9_9BILA
MYEVMSTNIPKEIMFYPGVPLPKDACEESFVPHEVVRKYLEDFSKDIRHLIRFGHKVERVEREEPKWKVTTSSPEGPKMEEFDVVFVCNGHYADP